MAVETVTAKVGKGAQYGFPVVPALHLLGDFRLIWGETPVMNIDLPRLQSLVAYLSSFIKTSPNHGRSLLSCSGLTQPMLRPTRTCGTCSLSCARRCPALV